MMEWTTQEATQVTDEVLLTEGPREDTGEASTWRQVFDHIQVAFTVAGFFANVLTLVTLVKSAQRFSRLIKVLLQHQSFVDACVCANATALLLQPHKWSTGNEVLDIFICHVWQGQATYWGLVTLSTYNLVLIALERFVAICKPFTHQRWSDASRCKLAWAGFALYVSCIIITHGCYIQTRYVDGECMNVYAFSGKGVHEYFISFVIFTYITTYFIPAMTMGILYSLVANQLRKRQVDMKLGKSKTIDRATDQLTKTAVVVTIIFIISIGYDLHYYLLGYTGVTEYQLNSAVQKVGVFLSNLNSCANPLVYALLMPIYRKCVMDMLCPRRFIVRYMEREDSNSGHTYSTTMKDLGNASPVA